MLSLKVTSNDSGTLPIMFLCWTQFCLQYLVASLQVWFRGHQSLSIWGPLCVSFKSWNKNSFHSFTSIPSIAMVDGVVQSDILASIRHNIVLRLLLRRLEIMRRLYVLFCFFQLYTKNWPLSKDIKRYRHACYLIFFCALTKKFFSDFITPFVVHGR